MTNIISRVNSLRDHSNELPTHLHGEWAHHLDALERILKHGRWHIVESTGDECFLYDTSVPGLFGSKWRFMGAGSRDACEEARRVLIQAERALNE